MDRSAFIDSIPQKLDLKPIEISLDDNGVRKPVKTIGKSESNGLTFKRYFLKENTHPFDEVNWEKRDSKILDEKGNIVFELKDLEIPSFWNQLATDIVVSKYFRKAGLKPEQSNGTGHEESVKQVITRISKTLRQTGENFGGYFNSKTDADIFEDELTYILLHQKAAFNSPVWFNCGLFHQYKIEGSGGNFYWNPKTDHIEVTTNAYEHPQCSACFIQSIEDDIDSIFNLIKSEARLFKYGSGTGTNFSKIRGAGEKLSGGGTSSGLLSFLDVLDRGAGSIKSGGTTRRAAKMVILDIDHPEIEEFIHWKFNEEKKAKILIEYGGYSSDYNGEAYKTISGQNSNNSVRVTDKFMEAHLNNEKWNTIERTTGKVRKTYEAKYLMDEIAKSAWACADPGIQFDTTINSWHTCPVSDKINASNPCSEFMFIDNSSCNLASINLLTYIKDGKFEIDKFRHTIELLITAMEIIVDFASYPTEKIAFNSHNFRPLGLGYANLGALLMTMGIPYDSPQGRAWAGAITAILHNRAYARSAEIAQYKGAFSEYKKNKEPFLKIVQKHSDATYAIDSNEVEGYIINAAREDASRMLELSKRFGIKNSQVTNIAPTGTIGLLMDCDTTGIEPDFSLVKFKKLAGGGFFKIVNQSVPQALKNLGYNDRQIVDIIKYAVGTGSLNDTPYINNKSLKEKGFTENDIEMINKKIPGVFDLDHAFTKEVISPETLNKINITSDQLEDNSFQLLKHLGFSEDEIEEASKVICGTMTMEGAHEIKPEHMAIFDCANRCGKYGKRFIAPMGHIKMMAAVQPFISGAISKTVNLPHEATIKDIENIYIEAWRLGVKAIAIYRDGSKGSQPLASGTVNKKIPTTETIVEYRPLRHRLPDERQSITHKFSIAGHNGFVTVGLYEDGTPGEIFITMSKEGTVISGLLGAFATSISYALQYGVPLRDLVNQFAHVRFEPSGFTKNQQIPIAKSIVDYISRWMAIKFLPKEDWAGIGIHENKESALELNNSSLMDNTTISLVENNQPQLNLNETPEQKQMTFDTVGDAPTCDICGGMMTRSGTCYKCGNCGSTSGCS